MGGGGRWGLVGMWRVEGMEYINMLYRIVSYRIVLYSVLSSARESPVLSASASLDPLPSWKGHPILAFPLLNVEK